MSAVADFEKAFADYVGAKHAIALCNGTATLHTALVALGVKPGDRVAVPPLTMSATTIAVLHAGVVPEFWDTDPQTWLMVPRGPHRSTPVPFGAFMPVSLYGLHYDWPTTCEIGIDDAAQTLRPHNQNAAFTSYSFQASKILPLGEGGMLVTDHDELAQLAREFSSLGYRMGEGPIIDKAGLKHPDYARHHSLGWNYRMSSIVAKRGLAHFDPDWIDNLQYRHVDELKRERLEAAEMYREVVHDCDWLTPQHVPDGWTHDYWTFAVATDTPERALHLLDAVEAHGGERPYPAWRLTYAEPAFAHIKADGLSECPRSETGGSLCPVAESIQPRLVQFQTNDIQSAQTNATALRKAIDDLS